MVLDNVWSLKMSQQASILISGPLACFARPEMKIERISYDVITPAAARGILEAIYWKPEIRWVVDEIRVVKPIQFHTLWRNNVGIQVDVPEARAAMASGDTSKLNIVITEKFRTNPDTVLLDVAYIVRVRMEDAVQPGRAPKHVHWDIFKRRVRRGQCFNQPCLGANEFPADVRLLEADERLKPIEESRDLGFMLYDSSPEAQRSSRFFRAQLQNGIVRVPPPNSVELRR